MCCYGCQSTGCEWFGFSIERNCCVTQFYFICCGEQFLSSFASWKVLLTSKNETQWVYSSCIDLEERLFDWKQSLKDTCKQKFYNSTFYFFNIN